jgi:hypothetical protein
VSAGISGENLSETDTVCGSAKLAVFCWARTTVAMRRRMTINAWQAKWRDFMFVVRSIYFTMPRYWQPA